MKYLPRSITGAVVAGFYLSIVGYLIWGFVFGSGGPHGEAGTSFLYAFIVTLPLSTIVLASTLDLKGAEQSALHYYLLVTGLAVCGLINATLIYLVLGFVSRALSALSKKPR